MMQQGCVSQSLKTHCPFLLDMQITHCPQGVLAYLPKVEC